MERTADGIGEIEKDIPPPRNHSRTVLRCTRIAQQMEPGDSVLCYTWNAMKKMQMKLGQMGKATASVREGDHFRLWCVPRRDPK